MQGQSELTRPGLLTQRRSLIERRLEIDRELQTVEAQLARLDPPPPPPKPAPPRRALDEVIVEKLRAGALTVAEVRGRIRRSSFAPGEDPGVVVSRTMSKLVREGRVSRTGHRYYLPTVTDNN